MWIFINNHNLCLSYPSDLLLLLVNYVNCNSILRLPITQNLTFLKKSSDGSGRKTEIEHDFHDDSKPTKRGLEQGFLASQGYYSCIKRSVKASGTMNEMKR